jgi:hypothetical protein
LRLGDFARNFFTKSPPTTYPIRNIRIQKNVHFPKFAHEINRRFYWPLATDHCSQPPPAKTPPKNAKKTAFLIGVEQNTPRNLGDSTIEVMEQFAIPEEFEVFPA